MSNHFCFDIETCSTESSAIVLSAAIVWFDPADTEVTYEQLVERSLYIKFNAKEQADKGRTVSKDTLEWWAKQSDIVRKLCFIPSKNDVSVLDGIKQIRDYVNEHGDLTKSLFWARGSLDQVVTDSLFKTFGEEPITRYNMWMDIRTAIRLLKETSTIGGYCDVPGFDAGKMLAHCPIDDCVRDILMLVRGV